MPRKCLQGACCQAGSLRSFYVATLWYPTNSEHSPNAVPHELHTRTVFSDRGHCEEVLVVAFGVFRTFKKSVCSASRAGLWVSWLLSFEVRCLQGAYKRERAGQDLHLERK